MDEYKLINTVYRNSLLGVTLSVLLVQLCVICNTILAGRLVGDSALAIMSLVNPLNFAFATVGSLLAVGGSILSARRMTERDSERSNTCLSTVVISIFVIGGLLTILGLLFLPMLMKFFSVPIGLQKDAKAYLLPFLPVAIASMGIYIPFNFLKLTGAQKYSVYLFALMAFCNISLDLLLAGVFSMGMMGIGLATSISYWIAFLTGIFLLYSKRGGFRFMRKKGMFKDLYPIFLFGSPSATNNLCSFLSIFCLNTLFLSVFRNPGLSAFSVISTITSFAVVAYNGTSLSMAQFVAVFSAEKDAVSMKHIFKTALLSGILMTGLLSVLIALFPSVVCDIFSVSIPYVRTVTIHAIRLFALAPIPTLINYVIVMFHQANKHAILANFLTILRGFVFVVLFGFLFRNAGLDSFVWLAFFCAEIATLFAGFLISLILSGRKKYLSRILLRDLYALQTGRTLSLAIGTDNNEVTECADQIRDFCEQHDLPPKTQMTVGLAIEEIIVSFNENALSEIKHPTKSYVKILLYDNTVVLRFRTGGKIYDPIAAAENDDDPMSLSVGVNLVKGLANSISYNRVFGVNNLVITIEHKPSKEVVRHGV